MKKQYDLSKYKLVFCDDYNALLWAYKNNLSPHAIIKTNSPKIFFSNLTNIKKMNKEIGIEKNHIYINLYKNYLKTLKKNFLNYLNPELTYYLLQKIYLFKRVVEKVSNLSIDDFKNEILFIKIIGDSGPDNELYSDDKNILNPPWEEILKNFENFTVIEYTAENHHKNKKFLKKKINFYKRIKFAGIRSVVYRLILKFNKLLPRFLFSKKILIQRENELIIDTVFEMFFKGYAINTINNPPNFIPTNHLNKDQIIQEKIFVKNLTANISRDFLKNFIHENFIENTIELLNFHLAKCIVSFKYKQRFYENILKNNSKKNIIFTSSPFSGNGNGAALCNISKKFNTPFIVFQHGVGAEIEKFEIGDLHPHESSLSNIYIAFNKYSKLIADKNNVIKNNIIGSLSSRHLNIKSKISNNTKSIIYVSTYLPKGNFSQDASFFSDIDTARFEIDLIEKVFSQVDNNFLYKTYPQINFRYLDGDPIEDKLNFFNIKYYNGLIDMRYMIRDFNLFITKDATSTVSWLLISDKPLIFINSIKKPINDNLKKIFKESLFYFEENDEEIFTKINNLLNLDFKKIINIYNNKSKKRELLIKDFFSHKIKKIKNEISKKIIELTQ